MHSSRRVARLKAKGETAAQTKAKVATAAAGYVRVSTEEQVTHGFGLEALAHRGMRLVVISRERNPVVSARCAKLRIECFQGIEGKARVSAGSGTAVMRCAAAEASNDCDAQFLRRAHSPRRRDASRPSPDR